MAKIALTRRMEKAKAPKTWIREVKAKENRIERLLETKETYLNIIDRLAREKEQLEAENESLNKRYYDLLLSVESVHSGETRHETALRYIQEAERGSDNAAKGE